MTALDLDPEIMEILACPQCHSNVSIDYESDEVVCIGLTCGLAYPIRDGIPVMLVEEARATRGRPNAPEAAVSPRPADRAAPPPTESDPAAPPPAGLSPAQPVTWPSPDSSAPTQPN